jgi:hypothetical protein
MALDASVFDGPLSANRMPGGGNWPDPAAEGPAGEKGAYRWQGRLL